MHLVRKFVAEECLRDKEDERSSENDGITSEMLTEIMEKCIRIFWDFIKADRNETNVILKGFLGTGTELQDPTDLELLTDIRADLQKVAFFISFLQFIIIVMHH